MCGIVACRTAGPALDYLRPALKRLGHRGYDSAGIAVQTAAGDVVRFRTTGRIAELERMLDMWSGPQLGNVGIGHTRWATHGAVTEENAHPHRDCTGRISLVHNGVVENAVGLRYSLAASGHELMTVVDSELLCHLIEDHLRLCDDLFTAVQSAMSEVTGSWALAAMDQQTGRVVVAAHRSPLLVARSPQGDFASSDITAIADWTDEYWVLEDGDVVELSRPEHWSRSGIVADPPAAFPHVWNGETTGLDGYTDFMAKEIDEQPERVGALVDAMAASIVDGSLWSDYGIAPFERVHIVACGSSYNAGMVIANMFRRLGGVPVRCTVASEIAEEVAEANTLCLAISQSGEIADVLRAVDAPAVYAAPLLAMTDNRHSALARRANAVMGCGSGAEIGVTATKTFVCQVVSGAALVISALVAAGGLSRRGAGQLVDDLRRLPDQLLEAIAKAKCVMPSLGEEFAIADGLVFAARGSGLPYAAEGALKVNELTYQWAQHFPAGEIKHGPMALIDRETPVVVVESGEPRLTLNIDEIRARGGRIVNIGGRCGAVPLADSAHVPWGPLPAAPALQILARSIALARHNDVDKPRHLAKAVTVD